MINYRVTKVIIVLLAIKVPLSNSFPHGSVYSLDPHEGVVKLRVYRLQVFEGQRLV